MLYREAGQYKTSYAADQAVFPILQDRIGLAVILLIAFVVIPAIGSEFLLQAMMIPVLVLALAAIGLNLLTGYTGLLSLGTGAFMGVGAYACYKLDDPVPGCQYSGLGCRVGLCGGRDRGAVRIAVAAHQRVLSRGCDARGAVLSVVVLHPRALALQLQHLRVDRGADQDLPRSSGHRADRHASHPLPRRAVDRRRHDLARLQSGARPHRPHVDGGARHGYRRRADRHQALSYQAAGVRGLLVLLRGRPAPCWLFCGSGRPSPKASTSTSRSWSCSWSSSAGSAA